MKEFFLKKRYGIPAALLILLAFAGVAIAVVVQTFNCSVATQEPLTFTKQSSFDLVYQGETGTITVKAENACPKQGYGILVDADIVKGAVDSITYSNTNLISTEGPDDDFNGDGDLWDARYNIAAATETGCCYNIDITVDSTDDAAAGDLVVNFDFHRKAKY